jgi:predicted O-linked N-acetylglucosamine transferase (SPINDLY family)
MTTTCEALWMGVPVVTLAGRSYGSRVGGSLLRSAGLDELIAGNRDEYVAIAVGLAREVARGEVGSRLKKYRESLRERMLRSALMDAGGFAKSMEEAYRRMWRKWCAERATG